jgi:hypothetical protein
MTCPLCEKPFRGVRTVKASRVQVARSAASVHRIDSSGFVPGRRARVASLIARSVRVAFCSDATNQRGSLSRSQDYQPERFLGIRSGKAGSIRPERWECD